MKEIFNSDLLDLFAWEKVSAATKSLLEVLGVKNGQDIVYLASVKILIDKTNERTNAGELTKNSDLATRLKEAKLPIYEKNLLKYVNFITDSFSNMRKIADESIQDYQESSSAFFAMFYQDISRSLSSASGFIWANIIKHDFARIYYFISIICTESHFATEVLKELNRRGYENDLSELLHGFLLMSALDLTPKSHQHDGVNKVLACILKNIPQAVDDYLTAVFSSKRENNRESRRHPHAKVYRSPIFYKTIYCLLDACEVISPKLMIQVEKLTQKPDLYALKIIFQERSTYIETPSTKKIRKLEWEENLYSMSKTTSEAKDEKKEIHKIDKEGLVSETICEPEIKNLKLDPVITNNFSQEVKKLEISSPDLTMTQDAIAQNATFSIRLKESKETDDFKTQIAEKKSQHETFLSHIEEELITTTDTEEKNSNWPSKNDFLLALQENEIELAKLSLHLEKLAEKEEKQKTIFVENFHFSKSEYEKIDLFKKALNLYLSDFIIKNIAIARQLADPKFNLFTQVVLSSVTFLATQFIPIPFIGTIIGESSKWFIKKQKIAQAQIVTHDLHTISEAAILIEHIVELTACSFQLLISKFHPLAIDVFAEAMVIRLAFCLNKKEIKAVADLKNLQKLAEHLVMYCSLHNTADDSPIKPKADSPLLAFRESKSTENMPLYRYETTNVVCRQSPIVFFEAKLQQYFYCKTSSDIAFQTNLPLRWASDYEKDYRNLGKSIRWLGILPISPLSLQNQQIKMELSAALKKIKQLEKQLAEKNLEIQTIQENVESKKPTKISNDYISTFSIRSTLNRSKSEPSFRKLSST